MGPLYLLILGRENPASLVSRPQKPAKRPVSMGAATALPLMYLRERMAEMGP